DHKIGKSAVGNALAGGWMIAAAFNFQSGFPIGVSPSHSGTNLLGNALRPNITGTPTACSGDLASCLGSADHPTVKWLSDSFISGAPGRVAGHRAQQTS